MSSLKHRLRLAAQRVGVELTRYPQADPVYRLTQLLSRERVDVVLDIGANRGEFGASLRRHGYRGRIISFEPVAEVYERLVDAAAGDPLWQTKPWALGDTSATSSINIAGNGGASSSMLPMLERHVRAAPASEYVDVQQVDQFRLDDLLHELQVGSENRVFLKLDVQGYEDRVLEGAKQVLTQSVAGMQIELSFVELYRGGMSAADGMAIAREMNMLLMGIVPGFTAPDGQMLQADAIFFRTDPAGDGERSAKAEPPHVPGQSGS